LGRYFDEIGPIEVITCPIFIKRQITGIFAEMAPAEKEWDPRIICNNKREKDAN
jgi:hypothetical protein